jgi:uncharacterized protein involved in response to NO
MGCARSQNLRSLRRRSRSLAAENRLAARLLGGLAMQSLSLAGEPPVARSPRTAAPLRGLAANGFRPFFLVAALLAVVAVPLWLLVLGGAISAGAGYLAPMAWHAHEMVFGFAVAVIAGFLLTAVRNWTGRETATGGPLYALALLWLLGRVVLAVGASLPNLLVATVDLAFVPALAYAIARPLVASKSKRNYVMLGVLAALFLANLAVHLDALGVVSGWQLSGSHAAVDIVVVLSAIIAGRVIPMFTRNATGSKKVVSVKALDVAAIASLAVYGALDVAAPSSWAASAAAATSAALLIARAARWDPLAALRHPLLWILHFGHAWIAVGLGLRAASVVTASIPATAATHALTVGAIGSLTLGMMARVSLGHTGRPLVAHPVTVIAFVLLTLAACLRVLGPLAPALPVAYLSWLVASGIAWALAFALFLAVYGRVLSGPRVDGRPG